MPWKAFPFATPAHGRRILLFDSGYEPLNTMTPQRNTNATLVDLLDRVLDKGLVIHADLIVSVAGIPLIGVNLRAALAGMETMLKYGIMQAWDEKSRAWERENRNRKKDVLIQGEEVILKMLGACHSTEGIYTAWRYGYLYLTRKRLFLYHQDFGEVLFETPMEKIRGLALREGEQSTENKVREELHVLLEGNSVCRLTALDIRRLKETLEKNIREAGGELQKDPGALLAQDAAPTEEKSPAGDETDTCPGCGKTAPEKELLNSGCATCGWTSPLKMEKINDMEIPA